MESESQHSGEATVLWNTIVAGAAGGLVGGVGMGVVLHAGANVMPFIGALFGWPTVAGGWVVHLVNSVLIGVLFAAILSRRPLAERTQSVVDCVVAGVLYAAAVGLVTAGLMLPITMNLLDVTTLPQPAVPIADPLGQFIVVISVGIAHVVYGLLLGATYGEVHDRPSRTGTPAT